MFQRFVFIPGKPRRAKIQEVHFFGKQEGCDLGMERQQKTDIDLRQIRLRPVKDPENYFFKTARWQGP